MKIGLRLFYALCLLSHGALGTANVVVDLPFQEKMNQAELVVIGTVTARQPENGHRDDGTVTVRVLLTLKGERRETVDVHIFHGAPEMYPPCCDVGATYLMFLGTSRRDGRLVSVGGAGGIEIVGGGPDGITVVPTSEVR